MDDVSTDPTNSKRKMVENVQRILPGENVARCVEALYGMSGEDNPVPEAITWLEKTAKK